MFLRSVRRLIPLLQVCHHQMQTLRPWVILAATMSHLTWTGVSHWGYPRNLWRIWPREDLSGAISVNHSWQKPSLILFSSYCRLSKREAAIFSEEDEDLLAIELSKDQNTSNSSPKCNVNNSNFERKNSFLGKLFSSKKKNASPSPASSVSKPAMGTFSAQFPPPELQEHYSSIYSSVNKKQQQPQPSSEEQQRLAKNSNMTSPMAQVRHGPNGNFVIYEHTAPNASPPISAATPTYGTYGQTEATYSKPPPPLPYRPLPSKPCINNNCNAESSPATSPPSSHKSNTPPVTATASTYQGSRSPVLYVHRTDLGLSPVRGATSSSSDPSNSNSSGPSSIDSQGSQKRLQMLQPPLFDDSLVVIERSNQELELKLSRVSSPPKGILSYQRSSVDTIHNHRNTLAQEVISEIDSGSEQMSRTSSMSTIKAVDDHHHQQQQQQQQHQQQQQAPSYPNLADLELEAASGGFKSLTAQKLMAGLNFSSVDTLLEVNAVAEARKRQEAISKMNESTETIDFGVI